MYGLMLDNEIIAIHDNRDTIEEFKYQKNLLSADIIKIKKRKNKKMLSDIDYTDLYLVRYGDMYVPVYLYDTLKNSTDQHVYDLKYCKEVLERIINYNDLSKKNIDAILRSINIINKEIYKCPDIDIGTLKNLKELNDEYLERISR